MLPPKKMIFEYLVNKKGIIIMKLSKSRDIYC